MKKITFILGIMSILASNALHAQVCTAYDLTGDDTDTLRSRATDNFSPNILIQEFIACDNGAVTSADFIIRDLDVRVATTIVENYPYGFDWQLFIYEGTGTQWSGINNVLASNSIGDINEAPGFQTFSFTNPVQVTSGTKYSIGLYLAYVPRQVRVILGGPNPDVDVSGVDSYGSNAGTPVLNVFDALPRDISMNVTVDTTLGVEEASAVSFSVYPNPVNNVVNIKSIEDIKSAIIYNATGKKLLETTSKQVDVSALATGLYFMHIEDAKGQTAVKRFIKQ